MSARHDDDNDDDDGMDDCMSMEEIWSQLCSNRMDAVSPKERNQRLNLAKNQILTTTKDKAVVDPNVIEQAVVGDTTNCKHKKSLHAQKRTCRLLLWTLKSSSSCQDDDDNDTKKLQQFLCETLCAFLLNTTTNWSLLWSDCQSQLLSLISNDDASRMIWKECFLNIAQEQANSISNNSKSSSKDGYYAAALSMASVLSNDDEDRSGWVGWWIQCALGSRSPSLDSIIVSQPFLSSLSNVDDWETQIVPSLHQKLRANPETYLETAVAILRSASTTTTLDVEMWLSCIQWKSSKATIRTLSTQLVQQLLRLASKSLSQYEIIVTEICHALTSSTKKGKIATLSTPDHRLGAYEALAYAATTTTITSTTTTTLCNVVLTSLTTALTKEVSSSNHKQSAQRMGWKACISWIMIAHHQKSSATDDSLSSGYNAAILFWSKQMTTDFRSTVTFLLTSTTTTTSNSSSSNKEDEEENGIMKSLWLDMWNQDSNTSNKKQSLSALLMTTLENCQKKHSKKSSSTTVQMDGLLALYLALLLPPAIRNKSLMEIVDKIVGCGSFALSSPKVQNSFLYSTTMMNAIPNNDGLIGTLLLQILILYSTAKTNNTNGLVRWIVKKDTAETTFSAATHVVACIIAHPPSSSYSKVWNQLQLVLNNSNSNGNDQIGKAIINAIYDHVQELSIQRTQAIDQTKSSREARELFTPIQSSATTMNDSTATTFHPNIQSKAICNTNTIRRVAVYLLSNKKYYISQDDTNDNDSSSSFNNKAWILTHIGTTKKLASNSRQRTALVNHITKLLSIHNNDNKTIVDSLSTFLVHCASSLSLSAKKIDDDGNEEQEQDVVVSEIIHEAALSMITTFGIMAGNFDPAYDDPEEFPESMIARQICLDGITPKLSKHLQQTLNKVDALTSSDWILYRTIPGVLCREDTTNSSTKNNATVNNKASTTTKPTTSSRSKKGSAKYQEEEWEEQLKQELAMKRKNKEKTSSNNSNKKGTATMESTLLSPEEKMMLEEQTKKRNSVSYLLDNVLERSLKAVQTICASDIEIGNECLPQLSSLVLKAAITNNTGEETLRVMASCVYEMDESLASVMARSLIIASTATKEGSSSSLPSPCSIVASVIQEMDDYDDCLSGPSFVFLFPLLKAALTGPRNIPGCEPALRILYLHISSMMVDDDDKVADPHVIALRKDIAGAILELLRHDRAQTFFGDEYDPFQCLISCYQTSISSDTKKLTSAELAPLLGEMGALGSKNCRLGAMMTLASIAADHPKWIKMNPLVENRVWLNCFAKSSTKNNNDDQQQQESIRVQARKAWAFCNNISVNEDEELFELKSPPSKMFMIPMLPLLSHSNSTIVYATADALAHGIGMHSTNMEKNIIRLCSLYIDSYPTVYEDDNKDDDNVNPSNSIIAPSKNSFPDPPKPTSTTSISSKKPKKKIVIDTGLPKKKKSSGSARGTSSMASLTSTKKKKTSKSVKAALAPKKTKERTLDQESLLSQFQPANKASNTKNVEKDSPEKIVKRRGVLQAIASIASVEDIQLELNVLKLLVGFLSAFCLADANIEIRDEARNTTRDIVAKFGGSEDAISFLLPHFESVLSSGTADFTSLGSSLNFDKVIQNSSASDRRKEGVVVALGSVALHLKDDDNVDKIDSTIDMLIDALRTSSESVQSSVALCLSKLMKKGRAKDRIESILEGLMKQCTMGKKISIRRGGAYGISAIVKGSGIASLKKYGIVKQLEDAITNGSAESKQGALFAIQQLCGRLGLLFEPYVIVLLPSLLKAFSDSSLLVREAAANAAGSIMSRLSAHGVKLVMPAVLSSFDEPEWRTKQASINMLGAMSHCAPKQLASCLPKVVPKLTEAFSDTHPKVKASAEEALDEISNVIRNPEVSSISKVLLKALTDPAQGTIRALESLIETEFLHAIDAPSLALIVPVIHRGLRDRLATTKRYGAVIAGNICTMINDPKDFIPYLSILLPGLKAVLLDPIPDVRSTSAKALGSLTRTLGEATFSDLRPWLIETFQSESGTSVERSGAAQGLTEVLVAGGSHLAEKVMREEILPLKTHPSASTREGVLWVLTFMPSSLGSLFAPLIDSSFPALISGLSDDSEPVRDVALRAGRVMIRTHGKNHIDKILPSLEEGLWDEDYRIRCASLMLLGDLLSMLGGTKVMKSDVDTQEDIRQAERAQAQISIALGPEKRKRVLSSLYIRRNDSAAVVRQNAVNVWKAVVSVTPRTLKEILNVLVGQIVTALASGISDQTEVAGRCLGDIVRKLGDAVLPEIIPVLRDTLLSDDDQTRRGTCVGLSEVIACSSKEQIEKYLTIIVRAVQNALCDDDEGVRQMAASCFENLYNTVGSKAFDEVVPNLLVAMESTVDDDESRSRAIVGLTCILSVRSRDLLPYLIPRLLEKPITKNHANALASIAQVTSDSIQYFLNTIIPSLLFELANFENLGKCEEEKEREEAIRNCMRSIHGSVDESGVNRLVSTIVDKCNSEDENVRVESCWMIQVLVTERKEMMDFNEEITVLLRELLNRLNDESPRVLKAVNSSFASLSKSVPAEELVQHIEFIRNIIAMIVSDARRRKGGVGDGEFLLPGLNMPKGLDPFLPIFQRGILYGDSKIREASAAGLGELIALTAKKYLAGPSIIKMTGPLLRIVGDRNSSAVKVAIINTLGLILTKGGPALRAFVPQFQTTFVKALSDPSRQVRIQAINALGYLMPLSTRLDPLIKELVSTSLGNSNNSSVDSAGAITIQTSALEALSVVLKHGGKKAKLPDSVPSSLEAGKTMLEHEDEGIREAAAKVVGAACVLLDTSATLDVLEDTINCALTDDSDDVKHGRAICCFQIFVSETQNDIPDEIFDETMKTILSLMTDDNVLVREAACQAVGALLGSANNYVSFLESAKPTILKCMDTKESIEVLKSMAKGLSVAARMNGSIFQDEVSLQIINAGLQNAMQGTQRVQLAFNDFLWLALDVENGENRLTRYAELAMFENAKAMKSLYSKVLVRIKSVDL